MRGVVFSCLVTLLLFVSFTNAADYGATPQSDYWGKTDLLRFTDDIVVYVYVEQDVFEYDNETNSTVQVPIVPNKAVFFPKVDRFSSMSIPKSK